MALNQFDPGPLQRQCTIFDYTFCVLGSSSKDAQKNICKEPYHYCTSQDIKQHMTFPVFVPYLLKSIFMPMDMN